MCAQQRLRSALGIHPVWSESSLCTQWVAKDPSFLHADSKDSDQTGQMLRLIWVFTGCTCHFVGFVVRRLICLFCFQRWIFESFGVLFISGCTRVTNILNLVHKAYRNDVKYSDNHSGHFWPESTLFAILSSSFGHVITVGWNRFVQIFSDFFRPSSKFLLNVWLIMHFFVNKLFKI